MRIIERMVVWHCEAFYELHFTLVRRTLGYIKYMVHSEHGFVAAYMTRAVGSIWVCISASCMENVYSLVDLER